MKPIIKSLRAREILDSRGWPTIEAELELVTGEVGRASVPSGASTGSHEALELRDGDPRRYQGKGVLTAIRQLEEVVAPALGGRQLDQASLDQTLIELDGSDNKARLGANALLAVSMAGARAGARASHLPLYAYLAQLAGRAETDYRLPMPLVNVLNGGRHAQGATDFQEYMLVPLGAPSFTEALRWSSEVFHTLGALIAARGWPTTVGDEGGYAPPLQSNLAPLELIMQAIEVAGYRPGEEIALALDVAANEFFRHDRYHLTVDQVNLTSQDLIELYQNWCSRFPLLSIEDGLAEDDWTGFAQLTTQLGAQTQLVGDDLFVTNPHRLQKGIESHTANAILIKLNQIGTVSETLATVKLAQAHHYAAIISHRSGETEDNFIADLAVGLSTGQIKTGSLSRSERLAKYNQLLRIEETLGSKQIPFARSSLK